MMRVGNYVFKRAETEQEFEQVHALNYRTFVSEISQYADNGSGVLVDKFHHKNNYFIVLRHGRLLGMLCTHDQAPFSVTDRLPDPSFLQQPGVRPLEVRLLAIEPEERNNTLFFGLIWVLYEFAIKHGYSHLIISGYEDRLDLYERLGFTALGPAKRCGDASFTPMALTIGKIPLRVERIKKMWENHLEKVQKEPVCLLPGPVTLSSSVRAAFHQPPLYHRGPAFIDRFMQVRRQLGDMVGGRDVAILNGSGTLANETIAATLAADQRCHQGKKGHGVLLINGEFGERLARQATRFGLTPRFVTWAWGEPWNLDQVDAVLAEEPAGSWIWGVHQESSTGILNDLPGLVELARKYDARVCVDCISSLGATPLDLSGVFLASGASGKALGSVAGAAIIFADRHRLTHLDRTQIPSYFDLATALETNSPCYTFPSPTLLALEAALVKYVEPTRTQETFARYHDLGVKVRRALRQLGLTPLAPEENASPVVTTFAPPTNETSQAFVARCRGWGYTIGGESGYLSQRRLVQIATMGDVAWDHFSELFDHLQGYLAPNAKTPVAV